MKYGKQRRGQIPKKRQGRSGDAPPPAAATPSERPADAEPVDVKALAPNNSYGVPDFVQRGYYVDFDFNCVDCGDDCVFTAAQQKWWYEVAKGQVYSIAKRCRACRHLRRPKPPAA